MRSPLVYLTVLAIATSGLVYELVAGTLASYVLGDSVTQFSTVIGVYLSALGLGSWLSRWVQRALARRFIEVELAVAVIGGASAPILFLAFAYLPGFFRPALYLTVTAIGTLVGLEIPLVLRILRESVDFKELVAKVLTFDYLGALAASLLFPILLVPRLGLVRTSLLFGLLSAAVGLWSTWLFRPVLGGKITDLRVKGVLAVLLLTVGFAYADRLTDLSEEGLYLDTVVLAKSSPYQRIVITTSGDNFQLFLNGNLQFSSLDEYRYHEALVHPALSLRADARRVLVLGGGDGLAAREILRYPSVEQVTLVDLDPEMTRLAVENPLLRGLNRAALAHPKVKVVNADAFVWLAESPPARFDVAIVDFPDPSSFSLGKLYTRLFYERLKGRLDPEGVVAIQSTSPLMARQAFWCINRTLESAGFHALPYHALVPSFGEWGFVLGTLRPAAPPDTVMAGLRFLDGPTLRSLFILGPDMAAVPVEVNRLDNQALVRYYEDEWRRWN
ncbi:MAG TPA: polyamine aminopropyltransferase [Vicinamibacteria bacterium]|nr:polyamine aminopropyltransferase [Vicinamibacteria bacterium]